MQYNITYRKKDNGWQYIISYKDSSGKWKQKSKQGFKATTAKKVPQEVKDAATEEVKNIKAKLVNNETLKDGIITFDSFCKTYLDHERLYRAENTIEVKERAFKKFNSLNEMIISDITSLNIQNCVDEMVKEGLSKVTIKHYLTLVKTMFNSAVEQHEIIAINPVKKIKLPEFESTKEKTALNQAEYEQLLSKISDYKLYLITLIAGSCGLRIGEIMGLSWVDIDEINMKITVGKQLRIVEEHSKHDIGKLKSKNSYRSIPISVNVLNALKKYDKIYPRNIDGRIFNYTNTKSIASRLRCLYRSYGYNISVHELRHTYATFLLSKGVDFKTAAQLMGHSVEQTMKTYSHVTDEMMEKAARIIRANL